MLYDYLIGNWMEVHLSLVIMMIITALAAILHNLTAGTADGLYKKWITYGGLSLALVILFFLILSPNKEWVIRHYGDPTKNLTDEQVASLENQYKHSERLFLSCLEKGQKQPHSTTFNDTNEVVKTCYDIAKLKF